jgi:hypothetical protein
MGYHVMQFARDPGALLQHRPPRLLQLDAQVSTARQIASAAGISVETRSAQDSLSRLRDFATGAGLLLALGVLAMTVGLIRSETGSDLRTLAAARASSRTRRTLTAATAGALALLGTTADWLLVVWPGIGERVLEHEPRSVRKKDGEYPVRTAWRLSTDLVRCYVHTSGCDSN